MSDTNRSNIATVPKSIKNVDNYGRISLPKLFITAAGGCITFEVSPEGITLLPATLAGQKILKIERGGRISFPRDVLRLYGNPVKMEVAFITAKPDKLLLIPYSAICAKCGATLNLHSLYKKEIFICTNCLNKAFDLHIPLGYADNSL